MKKEDLKIVQSQIEVSKDMYDYMKTSMINRGDIDWDDFNKQKVAGGILDELLKNELIDFETITLPSGNILIKGRLTVYKKKEEESE